MRRTAQILVAAIILFLGTVVFVQPASAAKYSAAYGGVQAELDTAPGNGYASWIWLYVPGSVASGRVEYKFFDGTRGTKYTEPDTTDTWNFDQKVETIRACAYTYFDTNYYWICSAWTSCCVDRVAVKAAPEAATAETPRTLRRRTEA
ncbi:hypothetical protein GCM10010129_73340 [Streptomyces fumigatiscleroticus]|nr:hypothetical protein GCM10010129_73340 [Streptomyces fumigatiscleroticus]